VRPDGATWTAGHAWDEVRVLSPPSGLKLEGGSLAGDRVKYLGKFLFVNGKLVNGRLAWQHTMVASLWIVFDGACWMGQAASLPSSTKSRSTSLLNLMPRWRKGRATARRSTR
jgi:hypothetical protein